MNPDTPDPLNLALPWRIALAITAGLLLTAGYALDPLWWAPWLAPLPLILSASGGRGNAWTAGLIAGAIATVSVLPYYFDMTGPVITALVSGLRILAWSFATRLTETASRRLPTVVAMLVLPATIAGLECLTSIISVHGSYGSLAYSQGDMPALIQMAAFGGIAAVVFVVLLPASFIGMTLARRQPKDLAAAGIAFAVIAAGVTGLSVQRLRAQPQHTIAATMIATDRFKGIPQDWQPVWAAYGPQVAASARAGSLVVLPEKIVLLPRAQAEDAAREVSAVAVKTGATVIVGIEVRDTKTFRNRALVASPDGKIAWYDKQRMVPVFEDRDTPGKTPLFASVSGTRTGVAICKDMHIVSIGHQYAGQARVMSVLAWDFVRDGWMAARITAMRGVENGYAVARSSRNGLVGAYDAMGRVLAEKHSSDGFTIVATDVPTDASPTLYSKIGDLFGYLCVLFAVAVRLWLLIRK